MNIHFQNPEFLYALFLIAIPIIIHLFNFKKYKTIYFSNLQFVNQIELQSRSRSKLKRILLLLSRILFVVFMVFAFAQPYIPTNQQNVKRNTRDLQVAIYVDNSFSMNADGTEGVLLESAKQKALSIVNAYSNDAKFYLLTNEFKISQNYSLSRDKCIEQIANIELSPITRCFSQIYKRVSQLSEGNCKLYYISDLQKSTTDIPTTDFDSLVSLNLVPMKAEKNANLSIDSCWFESPTRSLNQSEQLMVRIKNYSSEPQFNVPIQLYINDSLKSVATLNVEANSSTDVAIAYSISQAGVVYGRVELNDYPITFDNSMFFTYKIAPSINVLEISDLDNNQFLSAIFDNDEYFNFINNSSKKIDFSSFSSQQLIVLNGLSEISSGLEFELFNFVQNGGSLVCIPSSDIDIDSYNSFYSKLNLGLFGKFDSLQVANISEIDYHHNLLNNVFSKIDENILMPEVRFYYDFVVSQHSNNKVVMSLTNNKPYLLQGTFGRGKVYTITSPLDVQFTNFVRHPLFVSSVYNMALQTNLSTDLYMTIGEQSHFGTILPMSENNSISISEQNTEFEFIPKTQHDPMTNLTDIYFDNNITKAQNYVLSLDDKEFCGVAFNYNRSESEVDFFDLQSISSELVSQFKILNNSSDLISDYIKNEDRGLQLWKYAIILSLCFLFIEILIIRFLK